MARNTRWERAYGLTTDQSYYGTAEVVKGLQPGETILRTFWSFSAWATYGSTNVYPPNSSVTRAGLIVLEPGIPPNTADTPISQAGSDWYDITTITWDGNISTSTNVDWLVYGNVPGREQDTRAMRKITNPAGASIYLGWESARPDVPLAFNYAANWVVDALIAEA
jgi:hypothetical protein